MRVNIEHMDMELYRSPIFQEYFQGMEIVTADIETTGLSPGRASVILGGALAGNPDGGMDVIQYFADSPEDEEELLERYGKLLQKADILVTYNGEQFDLPFLRKRWKVRHRDPSVLDRAYSLDLYRILRSHSHLPQILPDLKQKTIERYLGEAGRRTDRIDGAESVRLYHQYVSSASAQERGWILDRILLHNRDDLVQLGSMLRILRPLNLHEILFHRGFPVSVQDCFLKVENIRLRRKTLKAAGRIFGNLSDYHCFQELFSLTIRQAEQDFVLDITCESEQGLVFADLQGMGMDTPELSALAGYESGYLLLRTPDETRWHEINALVRTVLVTSIISIAPD